jgi:hypothetical protein
MSISTMNRRKLNEPSGMMIHEMNNTKKKQKMAVAIAGVQDFNLGYAKPVLQHII